MLGVPAISVRSLKPIASRSRIIAAKDIIMTHFDRSLLILVPSGRAFLNPLVQLGYTVIDAINYDYENVPHLEIYSQTIAAPPPHLWTAFIATAKRNSKIFMFFGELIPSSMRNLRTVYVVDGMMGWFLWDMNFHGKPTIRRLRPEK